MEVGWGWRGMPSPDNTGYEIKSPEPCVGCLFLGFWSVGHSRTLQAIAIAPDCSPELDGHTAYHSYRTWKNQAGTNLKDSFLLDIFHSTIRRYVCCKEEKVSLSFT